MKRVSVSQMKKGRGYSITTSIPLYNERPPYTREEEEGITNGAFVGIKDNKILIGHTLCYTYINILEIIEIRENRDWDEKEVNENAFQRGEEEEANTQGL